MFQATRFSRRTFWVAALALAAVAPPAAHAQGLIVVSGDSNIGNGLNGSNGAPLNPGNQALFTNILGGGTRVLIRQNALEQSETQGPPPANTAYNAINTFYNSLSGVTSTGTGAPITTASLSGVNLFVLYLSDPALSTSEISDLTAFSQGGGSLFLIGDNNRPVFTTANSSANALLASIGSSIRIVPDALDPGFQTASLAQITQNNPLTANVTSLTYASTSQVTGGTSLVRTSGGQTFIAAERSAAAAPAPEPGTIALLLTAGVPVVGIVRRRAKSRA